MATMFQEFDAADRDTIRAGDRCHLRYRGVPVTHEHRTPRDLPRSGRRMFYRGAFFDGGVLDDQPPTPRRPQFYRGVYF
ncbi:MAG: hypothetical protein AAFX81_18350 [Pseudomonadota bacterium]